MSYNELFGNFTEILSHENNSNLNTRETDSKDRIFAKDGFDALRNLDSNKDAIVSSLDDGFVNLKVWQDLNQNGISEANELRSLSELGIKSIKSC